MTTHLHIVFSAPPEHVTDDDYNAWYDAHVKEILSVPGWVAATRYRVEGVVDPEHTGVYRYMSVYELEVPPAEALANLETAGLNSGESYVQLKDESGAADPLPLPDWFVDIHFGSMNAVATGARITSDR